MKRITYRELLNMIAEGNAPKSVRFDQREYKFNGEEYEYIERAHGDRIQVHTTLSGDISIKYYAAGMANKKVIDVKEEILDKVEKRYIRSALVPLKVSKVKKTDLGDIEHLTYSVVSAPEFFMRLYNFPAFKKGTMYKGMESERWYTVEELLK